MPFMITRHILAGGGETNVSMKRIPSHFQNPLHDACFVFVCCFNSFLLPFLPSFLLSTHPRLPVPRLEEEERSFSRSKVFVFVFIRGFALFVRIPQYIPVHKHNCQHAIIVNVSSKDFSRLPSSNASCK